MLPCVYVCLTQSLKCLICFVVVVVAVSFCFVYLINALCEDNDQNKIQTFVHDSIVCVCVCAFVSAISYYLTTTNCVYMYNSSNDFNVYHKIGDHFSIEFLGMINTFCLDFIFSNKKDRRPSHIWKWVLRILLKQKKRRETTQQSTKQSHSKITGNEWIQFRLDKMVNGVFFSLVATSSEFMINENFKSKLFNFQWAVMSLFWRK